jgi:hypothetical protein
MALACAAYGGHLAAMLLARGWGAKHNDSALVEAAVGGEIEAMHLLREWGARDYANAQHYATPEAWALLAAWIQEERSRIA